MKKKLLLAALTALGSIFLFTGCGKKIDLNDALQYEFEGYDGYGTISTGFDDDMIQEAIYDATGDEDETFAIEVLLETSLDGSWSEDSSLSNGDKVTFSWNLDDEVIKEIKKEYKVNIKYSDVTAKVDGLKDPSEFTFEDYVTCTVSGIGPNGTLSINSSLNNLSVTADKESGLSNGDEVTITIAPYENTDKTEDEICAENGIPQCKGSFTYTVSGLASYVTEPSQIPAGVLSNMATASADCIANQQSDSDTYDGFFSFGPHKNFVSAELYEYGILTGDSEYDVNQVYFIYKLTYNCHGDVTTYVPVYFKNVTDASEGDSAYYADANYCSTYCGLKDFESEVDGYEYLGDSDLSTLKEDIESDYWGTSTFTEFSLDSVNVSSTGTTSDADKTSDKEKSSDEYSATDKEAVTYLYYDDCIYDAHAVFTYTGENESGYTGTIQIVYIDGDPETGENIHDIDASGTLTEDMDGAGTFTLDDGTTGSYQFDGETVSINFYDVDTILYSEAFAENAG